MVLAGILAATQLAIGVRKEMRELIDANLMQYASSLYMLEQQVQGYGHVSEPLNLDVRINRVVYSLFDKSNFVVSRRGLSYLMICEV